jgi:hypothetical protein
MGQGTVPNEADQGYHGADGLYRSCVPIKKIQALAEASQQFTI